MRTKSSLLGQSTRREFIGRAAAMAACAAITPHIVAAEAASKAKPNSVIHGVRVGVITYSYRGGNINTAEETLKALLEDGLSEVELMDGPIRSFAGPTRTYRLAGVVHRLWRSVLVCSVKEAVNNSARFYKFDSGPVTNVAGQIR